MARYDKYEPKGGGFRARLNADQLKTSAGNPLGVGLNGTGRVVLGAGTTGIVGVLATTKDMKAGDVVDVMTHGECVECITPLVAGSIITANTTTGVLSLTAASLTQVPIGFTAEALTATQVRLIVRRGMQPFIGT